MISENIKRIKEELPSGVKLVAVSKFHPVESVLEAAEAGQVLFGESRPQELAAKVAALEGNPLKDSISFHFIGHLQTNKLKMVLPNVDMVESVDSQHLLDEIDKWGQTTGRVVNILLELHLGAEETKQGFTEEEILDLMFRKSDGKFRGVRFCGLMGMATHTEDPSAIEADFSRLEDFFLYLKDLFPEMDSFTELSAGMSGDWKIAVGHGSTMVRIGTAIFGERV